EPVRHVIPGRERIIARCQFRVRRYDTECLLPSEYLLAKTVPPLIELALVLAGPGGGDMVRSMAAPGSEVDKERSACVLCTDAMQPLDCLVGHGIGQVERFLLVVEAFWNADDPVGLGKTWIPLTRVTAKKPIEVVEAPATRPPFERPSRPLLYRK